MTDDGGQMPGVSAAAGLKSGQFNQKRNVRNVGRVLARQEMVGTVADPT
jgi:hypothetical protein